MLARSGQRPVKVDNWCDISLDEQQRTVSDPLDFDAAWLAPYIPFDQEVWRANSLNSDEAVRVRTARYLGWRHDAQSLNPLIEMARSDESSQVRLAAVESLGWRAEQNSFPVLLQQLGQETHGAVRWAIQETLDRITNKRAKLHLYSSTVK